MAYLTDDASFLRAPYLIDSLADLRGRKIVFSNAPLHYAEEVLSITGVRDLFDHVCSIERVRFRPKPAIQGFRRMLRKYRLRPAHCVP